MQKNLILLTLLFIYFTVSTSVILHETVHIFQLNAMNIGIKNVCYMGNNPAENGLLSGKYAWVLPSEIPANISYEQMDAEAYLVMTMYLIITWSLFFMYVIKQKKRGIPKL